jgi:riboflavin synthase
MFTGIIEATARIEALENSATGGRLRVDLSVAPALAASVRVSDSIAVNGCCLTAVECDARGFSADLSGETLRRTSFGERKTGDIANIERPLAASARLGGHFVQGHVDGVGRVTELRAEGENWWLSVRVPDGLRKYVAEKGSIAIDGISLTVARWAGGIADFAVIPFTYQHTSVQQMATGSPVNIETDILAKYMESLLGRTESGAAGAGLSVERLIEQGF